ncbi:MAG: hypothetical protein ACI81W_001214, partial [Saprospiraceae bacterium]
MKKLNLIFPIAILTLLISSCSPKLTPFTEDLQQENGWSESELKQIQFYVSKD